MNLTKERGNFIDIWTPLSIFFSNFFQPPLLTSKTRRKLKKEKKKLKWMIIFNKKFRNKGVFIESRGIFEDMQVESSKRFLKPWSHITIKR